MKYNYDKEVNNFHICYPYKRFIRSIFFANKGYRTSINKTLLIQYIMVNGIEVARKAIYRARVKSPVDTVVYTSINKLKNKPAAIAKNMRYLRFSNGKREVQAPALPIHPQANIWKIVHGPCPKNRSEINAASDPHKKPL